MSPVRRSESSPESSRDDAAVREARAAEISAYQMALSSEYREIEHALTERLQRGDVTYAEMADAADRASVGRGAWVTGRLTYLGRLWRLRGDERWNVTSRGLGTVSGPLAGVGGRTQPSPTALPLSEILTQATGTAQ